MDPALKASFRAAPTMAPSTIVLGRACFRGCDRIEMLTACLFQETQSLAARCFRPASPRSRQPVANLPLRRPSRSPIRRFQRTPARRDGAYRRSLPPAILRPRGVGGHVRRQEFGRARERLSGLPDRERLRLLLQRMERQNARLESVPVANNGRIVFIKTRDIHWIESAGNYARLHLASGHHDIRDTLTRLEAKLDSKEFVRIHRSILVNLHYVKEVHPWFHGYHLVLLESGQELRMSRYQREVAERLGLRGT